MRSTRAALTALVAIGAASVAACSPPGGAATGEAGWVLRRTPAPDDTVLELLVQELACSSGRSADDRIEVEVVESDDRIELDVRVRARSGDQTCPGNPRTPHTVDLDTPVGDREIRDPTTATSIGLDDPDPAATPVEIVDARGLERPLPSIASEQDVALSSIVDLSCDDATGDGEAPREPIEPTGEHVTERAAVAAAIDQLGLSTDRWHVLRQPTPWYGGSSTWVQFFEGEIAAQIWTNRRTLGWSAIGTSCADLPARWSPDTSFGDVDRIDVRRPAPLLDIAAWLGDTDLVAATDDGWRFTEPDQRCRAWVAIEDAALAAGATLTFTSWFGEWPGGDTTAAVEGITGFALDGRGARIVTGGDRMRIETVATDLVWSDVSSPRVCRLDDMLTARPIDG